MGKKRLSPSELTRAIEKIRKGYDDFRVQYITDGRERRSFEERYIQALRSRTDMAAFVAAEMEQLQNLTEKAEEQRRQETERLEREQRRKRASRPKRRDFADEVIIELKKRVSKYTPVGLDLQELWEVDHLYGALLQFEREYWPKLERIYRRIYPSRYSGPRLVLENRLNELTESRADGFPKRLYSIRELLGRFPRTLREIEWEAKQCILQASFFLHTLKSELKQLIEDGYLRAEEKKTVETALHFVHTVIEDFRLQDLKEKDNTARS